MKHIGEALRFVRLSLHINQKIVAELAGLTDGALSMIETGKRDPSWSTLNDICTALGVDVAMVALLLDSNKPVIKPLVPIVYTYLWETARNNGQEPS